MSVHRLPRAGGRLAGMAAAPWDALALVDAAIERVDNLADLIRRSAPSAEIAAAGASVAALRAPLASIRLTVEVLDAALRVPAPGAVPAVAATAGRRPRPRGRAQLYAIPAGPQEGATRCATAPTPGGAS